MVALCYWRSVKISDLWLLLAMQAAWNVPTWHARVSWSHFLLDIRKCLTLDMKWVWHPLEGIILQVYIAIRNHLSAFPPLKLCQEKLNFIIDTATIYYEASFSQYTEVKVYILSHNLHVCIAGSRALWARFITAVHTSLAENISPKKLRSNFYISLLSSGVSLFCEIFQ